MNFSAKEEQIFNLIHLLSITNQKSSVTKSAMISGKSTKPRKRFDAVESLAGFVILLRSDDVRGGILHSFFSSSKPAEVSNPLSICKTAIPAISKAVPLNGKSEGTAVETVKMSQPSLPNIKVGNKLYHKAFGEGTVKNLTADRITVRFGSEEKKFDYPAAFVQGFLKECKKTKSRKKHPPAFLCRGAFLLMLSLFRLTK